MIVKYARGVGSADNNFSFLFAFGIIKRVYLGDDYDRGDWMLGCEGMQVQVSVRRRMDLILRYHFLVLRLPLSLGTATSAAK